MVGCGSCVQELAQAAALRYRRQKRVKTLTVPVFSDDHTDRVLFRAERSRSDPKILAALADSVSRCLARGKS
jgi:hypothetical protein